ncbi:MAG: Gfo/Idh/MocA family oxidoreductase [candidate division Zixibacteria bacterium]|nr:Gfo/Idh/MocA family oxidoreductase [candidate division Zixibacteria bacterium]
MIRIGSIGLGGMGLYQARTFSQAEGCRLVAGADPSPEMRERFAKTFPGVQVYDSPEKLIAQPDIDAVVVAVPTGRHQRVASAALAARKPVLLEKPMARTVPQCLKLIEDAKKYDTLLMVAHCRRFDPHWKSWGEYVTSGRLGHPILWRHALAGFGPGSWFMDRELGGGPLIDGAVHDYDFANWIFGEPESVVSSSIKMDPSVTAIDTGSAVVRYKNGSQLLVSWSWSARGNHLHDVIGPAGFIQFGTGGLTPSAEEEAENQYCYFTDREGKQTLIGAKKQPDMYTHQALHFLACIRGETTCLSPGTEAIKAIAVAEAILKAGPKGRAVKVNWQPSV